MEAFGFVRPPESEARLIREFAWEPVLAFLREARVNIPFDELRRINKFIREGGAGHELVPIKERSLQIFGTKSGSMSYSAQRCFVRTGLFLNAILAAS